MGSDGLVVAAQARFADFYRALCIGDIPNVQKAGGNFNARDRWQQTHGEGVMALLLRCRFRAMPI
jgi:hypothetical protein